VYRVRCVADEHCARAAALANVCVRMVIPQREGRDAARLDRRNRRGQHAGVGRRDAVLVAPGCRRVRRVRVDRVRRFAPRYLCAQVVGRGWHVRRGLEQARVEGAHGERGQAKRGVDRERERGAVERLEPLRELGRRAPHEARRRGGERQERERTRGEEALVRGRVRGRLAEWRERRVVQRGDNGVCGVRPAVGGNAGVGTNRRVETVSADL
jgi:hypothetical protein